MRGTGLLLIGIGLRVRLVLSDGTEEYYDSVSHHREHPEAALVVVGVILVLVAVIDAAVRLVRGPQEPRRWAHD